MVDFKPFRGLIPNLAKGERIEERIAPPYDVIEQQELQALQSHPFNVTRITLGGRDDGYQKAAKELESWIERSRLKQDVESFYLYRQTFVMEGKPLTRTGITGLLRLEEYSKGNIIPHEETIPRVKEDRLALLRDTATHSESIFGVFEKNSVPTSDIVSSAEPLFECETGGIRHQFLRVSDDCMKKRIADMMRDKRILIADGHHRFETALRYSQENPGDPDKAYVLATLVSAEDKGMIVLPAHRLVRGVRLPRSEIARRLRESFEVDEVMGFDEMMGMLDRLGGTSFGLVTRDDWMSIVKLADPPDDDVLWMIDAYACQELLFRRVLADDDLEIEYEESSDEVRRRMASGDFDLAVLLPSPTLDDIWRVTRAGKKMPKKSTYFYPKIWSGFVYYRMQ